MWPSGLSSTTTHFARNWLRSRHLSNLTTIFPSSSSGSALPHRVEKINSWRERHASHRCRLAAAQLQTAGSRFERRCLYISEAALIGLTVQRRRITDRLRLVWNSLVAYLKAIPLRSCRISHCRSHASSPAARLECCLGSVRFPLCRAQTCTADCRLGFE